jgi:hypothetical protein
MKQEGDLRADVRKCSQPLLEDEDTAIFVSEREGEMKREKKERQRKRK